MTHRATVEVTYETLSKVLQLKPGLQVIGFIRREQPVNSVILVLQGDELPPIPEGCYYEPGQLIFEHAHDQFRTWMPLDWRPA